MPEVERFVRPKVFLVGFTEVDRAGLTDYLKYTKQEDFLRTFEEAVAGGMSTGEALCVFYAKTCYKSLVVGRNKNVTRVRDAASNLANAHDQGHGSVIEHASVNLMATDVSRVFTHELVRHRVGAAYSQTSGRFCRLEDLQLVWDPILDGCQDILVDALEKIEDAVYLIECRKGLRKPNPEHPDDEPDMYMFWARGGDGSKPVEPGYDARAESYKWVVNDDLDFDYKKKVTSAARRIAPNGQPNEIGFTLNFRSVRHLIQARTAPQAEFEIRDVFNQVFDLLRPRFPGMFHRARVVETTKPDGTKDGLRAVSGMRMMPYELTADSPEALKYFEVSALQAEIARRSAA